MLPPSDSQHQRKDSYAHITFIHVHTFRSFFSFSLSLSSFFPFGCLLIVRRQDGITSRTDTFVGFYRLTINKHPKGKKEERKEKKKKNDRNVCTCTNVV